MFNKADGIEVNMVEVFEAIATKLELRNARSLRFHFARIKNLKHQLRTQNVKTALFRKCLHVVLF